MPLGWAHLYRRSEVSGAENQEMFMTNAHRNAESTDRSFSFNLNAMSILAFCRAIDCGNSPVAELDMFSRWIRLSDDLLAADWKPLKKMASRSKKRFGIAFSAKSA
jgi:hypothetical protein